MNDGLYRDAAPGVQARLDELRAAWKTTVDTTLRAASAAVRARSARIGGGFAAVVVQLLATLWTIHSWTRLPMLEGNGDCGGVMVQLHMMALGIVAFLGVILLARWLGRVVGGRIAAAQVARLVEVPGADPGLELERLVHLSPTRALAVLGSRLEVASVLWSLTARGLPLVVLPLFVSLQLGEGGRPWAGPFHGALIALGMLLCALGFAFARLQAQASAVYWKWVRRLLVVATLVLAGVAVSLGALALFVAALQLTAVISSLLERQFDVSAERLALGVDGLPIRQ